MVFLLHFLMSLECFIFVNLFKPSKRLTKIEIKTKNDFMKKKTAENLIMYHDIEGLLPLFAKLCYL